MSASPISHDRREATARIFAIGEDHGRGFIRDMPKEAQIAVCEKIIATHPNRSTVLWARSLYLSLTDPEPTDAR